MEDVAQALRERGERVSLTSVQKELGRGSFITVKRLLNVWLLEHPEHIIPQLVPLAALPDRLVTELGTVTRGLWTVATEVAESWLQAEREGCRQQVLAAEADRDAAATVADALAATNETLTEQVSELQEQLAETQQRGLDADTERSTLAAQLAQEREAGQTAAALAAAQERHNADLKVELEEKRVTLASGQKHRADASKHAEQWVPETRAALERQVAAAEVQVIRRDAEATVAGLRGQLDQVRSEAAQVQGALKTTQAHLETQTRLLEQALAPSMAPAPETRQVKATNPIRAHPPQAAGKP